MIKEDQYKCTYVYIVQITQIIIPHSYENNTVGDDDIY